MGTAGTRTILVSNLALPAATDTTTSAISVGDADFLTFFVSIDGSPTTGNCTITPVVDGFVVFKNDNAGNLATDSVIKEFASGGDFCFKMDVRAFNSIALKLNAVNANQIDISYVKEGTDSKGPVI